MRTRIPARPTVDLRTSSYCALKELADLIIRSARRQNPVTIQDAAGVGIDHEYRMLTRVKQDGVCRLWPDPIECQQFVTEFSRRLGEHAIQ